MNHKKRLGDILYWLSVILFIIFAIIAIIQLGLKITGNSPSSVEVLLAMTMGIIVYLVGFTYKAGIFVGEVREFMKNTKDLIKETNNNFTELRRHTDNSFIELRKEIDNKFIELRKEIDNKFIELRSGMDYNFTELRKDIKNIK